MRISACVIVKNEERNINRWLDNMLGLADEIVVVDTGSRDKTVELVRQRGIEPYHFEWCNDFAAAKNYAVSKATGDWIVFLDADEYFDARSVRNFASVLQKYNRAKNVGALLCRLVDIDEDNKNMVKGGMLQVRIFRNVPGIAFVGAVHEQLQVIEGSFIMQYCKQLRIYHTGYSTSIVRKKAARNLSILLEEEKRSDGDNAGLYLFLADAYFALEQYDRCLEYSQKALQSGVRILGDPGRAYKSMISAMVGLKKTAEEVMSVLDEAIEKFPEDVFFMLEKGHFYYTSKDYLAAGYWLSKAHAEYEKQGVDVSRGDGGIIAYMPVLYGELSAIELLRGRKQQALEFVFQGLEYHKYNVLLTQNMHKALSDKPVVDIIQVFNSIYDRQEDGAYLLDALKGIATREFAAYYGGQTTGSSKLKAFLMTGNYVGAAVLSRRNLRMWQHLVMADAVAGNTGELLPLLPEFYQKISGDCNEWANDDDLQAVRRLLQSMKN